MINRRINNAIASGNSVSEIFDNGTLWFTAKNVLLLSEREKLNPESYVIPRLFVWVPRLLGAKIKCPFCRSEDTTCKGWGDNPIARRVVDLHDCYFVMSRRQRCNNCSKSFFGHDSRVLDDLPDYISSQCPAFLTSRSGIDKKLLCLLRTCISESMGPEPFQRMLRENHIRKYMELKTCFMSSVWEKKKAGSVIVSRDKFPAFWDPEGYGGFVPSSRYLVDVYVKFVFQHENELLGQVAKAPGSILSLDFSHKVI